MPSTLGGPAVRHDITDPDDPSSPTPGSGRGSTWESTTPAKLDRLVRIDQRLERPTRTSHHGPRLVCGHHRPALTSRRRHETGSRLPCGSGDQCPPRSGRSATNDAPDLQVRRPRMQPQTPLGTPNRGALMSSYSRRRFLPGLKKLSGCAAVVVLTLGFAGCTSGGSSSSDGVTDGPRSAQVQTACDRAEAGTAEVQFKAPGGAVDGTALEGKSIYVIPIINTGTVTEYTRQMEEGGCAAGSQCRHDRCEGQYSRGGDCLQPGDRSWR